MTNAKNWVGCTMALVLAAAGCGDNSTGGGPGGSGGSGGGSANEDAQLVYEGDPLLLDTVNVCQVGTDGMVSNFIAGIQSEDGAPDQVTFTLGIIAEPLTGTGLFDSLSTRGSAMDLELPPVGQVDLVGFDPDMVQMITGGMCEADVIFRETQQFGPTLEVDVYDVSFACPLVEFNWFDIGTSTVTGNGTLTDLSGEFSCFMTIFE